MKLTLIGLIISIACFKSLAQVPFLIEDYYHLLKAIDLLNRAYEEENWIKIDSLYNHVKQPKTKYYYYGIAKAKYHLKAPFENLLDSAITLGANPKWENENEPFLAIFREHESNFFLHKNPLNTEEEQIAKRLKKCLTLDQTAQGSENYASISHQNRLVLDSIIQVYGWPSSFRFKFDAVGPVIFLIHQNDLSRQDFEHYFNLVTADCLNGKETWDKALFILTARYQYLASDLRVSRPHGDTLELALNNDGKLDPFISEPYVAAMSKKLCENSKYNLQLTLQNYQLGEEIKTLLFKYNYVSLPPKELLEMMISEGYQIPKGYTHDRLKLIIDPKISKNQIQFKFL